MGGAGEAPKVERTILTARSRPGMFFGSLSLDGARSCFVDLLTTCLTRNGGWSRSWKPTVLGLEKCRLNWHCSGFCYQDRGPRLNWEEMQEWTYLLATAAVSSRLEILSGDWSACFRDGQLENQGRQAERLGLQISWAFSPGYLPHPDPRDLYGLLGDLALTRAPLEVRLKAKRREVFFHYPRGLEDAVRERDQCRVGVGPMLIGEFHDRGEGAKIAVRPCQTGPVDVQVLVNGWRCCLQRQSEKLVREALRRRKLSSSCTANVHLKLNDPLWQGSVKDEEMGSRAHELLRQALASLAER